MGKTEALMTATSVYANASAPHAWLILCPFLTIVGLAFQITSCQ